MSSTSSTRPCAKSRCWSELLNAKSPCMCWRGTRARCRIGARAGLTSSTMRHCILCCQAPPCGKMNKLGALHRPSPGDQKTKSAAQGARTVSDICLSLSLLKDGLARSTSCYRQTANHCRSRTRNLCPFASIPGAWLSTMDDDDDDDTGSALAAERRVPPPSGGGWTQALRPALSSSGRRRSRRRGA